MRGKELREALHAGRRVYGTLIVSTSPAWPKVVGGIGLDFVFIDTEHIAIDRSTLSWMCRIYDALGLSPLVRIPSPDPYQACMALDDGAEGIMVPYVESAEQVRRMVGAVKHRPLKGDRLQELLAGNGQVGETTESYLRAWNEDSYLVVNIESVPALDALEEIVAVPGLDAVLIGPHDLSINLGCPEEYENPRFTEAVKRIFRTARDAGVGAGCHLGFPGYGVELEKRWMEQGANLILHKGDIIAFQETIARDIGALKGDEPASGDSLKGGVI